VRPKFEFSVGEMVRIKSGAFQAFTARIEEVDEKRATLKVMVRIFGRSEPIELRFVDVEKISFREEE
jgi:transcription termination/antitermination protein NusG